MEQTTQNQCFDCGKELKVVNEEIVDGFCLKYKDGDNGFITILKCGDCYAQDKSLKNFREIETYSRVVGYIRPVQQWNTGKRAEFKDRKEFKL